MIPCQSWLWTYFMRRYWYVETSPSPPQPSPSLISTQLPKRASGCASIYDAPLSLKYTPTVHRRRIKLFADHFTIFPANSPTLYVDYAINFYQLKNFAPSPPQTSCQLDIISTFPPFNGNFTFIFRFFSVLFPFFFSILVENWKEKKKRRRGQ